MSGSRLKLRLVVQLVLVTGLACGLMGWAAYAKVQTTFEASLVRDLDERNAAAAAAVDLLRERALAASDALITVLRVEDPNGLRRLLAAGSPATAEAARLRSQVGLDWLEILNDQGTVVSSAAWPEQAGLRQEEFLELPADVPRLLEVATATHASPALVVRRAVPVGDRVLHLVGGVLLDAAAFALIDGGRSWLDVQFAEDEPYSVGRPAVQWASRAQAGWQEQAGRWHAEVRDSEQSRWVLTRTALGAGESGPSWLVTAAKRDRIDQDLAGVQRALVGFGVLAALLAALAGLWIARRVTAPVAELVRSVDAIAAGTEDYTFTRATENEFEDLTTAFSRLHRSLELQRERSRAAERVAAWRDVARRVAHEVKNPLVPIRLTVENLLRARSRPGTLFDEMFDEGAGTILEEVDRLKRLVGEFSEFARLPLPDRKPGNLVKLVDDVAALFRAERDVDLEVVHCDPLPTVQLDADQIARALTNVVGNAVDALREQPKGRPRTVTIRTSMEDNLARVDVEDSGPGLTPEALDQLFEPYFTTKPGGTGLGLSITYRMITEHGGVLSAENRDEGGARVTLRLPT